MCVYTCGHNPKNIYINPEGEMPFGKSALTRVRLGRVRYFIILIFSIQTIIRFDFHELHRIVYNNYRFIGSRYVTLAPNHYGSHYRWWWSCDPDAYDTRWTTSIRAKKRKLSNDNIVEYLDGTGVNFFFLLKTENL